MKAKKIAILGILTSMALMLSIMERIIPLSVAIPGVKLGLANLIIVYVMIKYGLKDAVSVSISRIILASIFAGGMNSFLYSLSGATLSLIFMAIVYKTFGDSITAIGVSVTGGFFHCVGQVLMAVIYLQNIGMLLYLPMIAWAGIISGVLIGFISQLLLQNKLISQVAK
jgi:heptaprenyl diphosphate synthase